MHKNNHDKNIDNERSVCQALMDEYELLRERIEVLDLARGLTLEQLAEFGITQDDIKRLRELEKELDKNCSDQFSKFSKIDFGPGIDNGMFSNSDN